ncbi:hypothetical protein FRC19_011576 [Serendipita sp. 401]|nr:hypothetical protein FRC19_011576 [Serendipita sp. 401]KAG9058225.1 hypothetical protein FS842_000166 [Serendipita sp. 407]
MDSKIGQSTGNSYSGQPAGAAPALKKHSATAAAIAKEQITTATKITRAAVFSGTYIWPLQGQYHFLTHPALFKPVLPNIIKSTLFTIGVTVLLFILTYLPTVAVLAFVSGPFAFIAAIPVILGEGAAIGIVVAKIFWLGQATERLFDEVLVQQGLTKLVSRGREMQSDGRHGKRIGKLLTKPLERFSKENIIRWLISLPLTAIPVVGPAAFFLYNGAKSGPSYHARYFQLKSQRDRTETYGLQDQTHDSGAPITTFNKAEFVTQHRGEYSAFGAMAMALNVLVPGGAIVCLFGNQVGAALWAAEIEKSGGDRKVE